jgi:hypothetical protein
MRIGELDDGQVDRFLLRGGPPFAGIRACLAEDQILRGLVRSPLMLFMLTYAWWGRTVDQIKTSSDRQNRRDTIYEMFALRLVNRCLAVRSRWFHGPHVLYWLAALARKMKQHNMTHFIYERLQPNWLQQGKQGRYFVYSRLMALTILLPLVIGDFLSGLVVGPLVGLFIHKKVLIKGKNRLVDATVVFLLLLISITYLNILTYNKFFRQFFLFFEEIAPHTRAFMNLYEALMLFGPVVPAFAFASALGFRMGNRHDRDLMPVEVMVWSWRDAFRGLGRGLLFSIPIAGGLAYLFTYAFGSTIHYDTSIVVPGVVFCSLLAGVYPLLGSLLGGRLGKRSDLTALGTQFGQGLDRAVGNMWRSGLMIGVICSAYLVIAVSASFFMLMTSQYSVLFGVFGTAFLVFITLVFSFPLFFLYGALWHGGLFIIQHYTLGAMLQRAQIIPRRLPKFLDYATRLGFLVKVGGSYQFFHQCLRDFFAEVDITDLLRKLDANTVSMPVPKEITHG